MHTTPLPPPFTEPERPYEVEPPVILLAEDDPLFRALVGQVLRADGYVVIEARDGDRLQYLVRALLQSGRDPRPELIISDIRMPGLSGLDILETLRELDWYTPVILMTGFGGPESTAEAERLGAAAVLSKPFDLEELRRRVRDILPIV